MKRAFVLAAALMVTAAPLLVPAQGAAQKASSYTAPRLSYGQPSLEGYWTNGSLTPEIRQATYGDRLVMTAQEVARAEGAAARSASSDNDRIDPNAPPPSIGGDLPPGATQFSGAGGNVGGYDIAWLDPGRKVMRVGGEPRTSFLTTPNGRPPAPKAGAARGGGFGFGRGGGGGPFDNPEIRTAGERCMGSFGRNTPPPMLPNGFYNNNYQIVQSPQAVAIMVEMVHDVRVIRLNAKHRTDGVRPHFGDSIGWWDGDTLVVETTNFPRSQAYNGSWENLKVTERFTRTAKDRLRYKYTIEDPTMWDAAWGGEYEFAPLNGIIYEYACHEGNYALEGMLAGAREEERIAATGEKSPVPTGRALNAPIGGLRPPR